LGTEGKAVVLAAIGVGFSYSLLSIGSGIIIGLRISFWMFVGGVIGWILLPYLLVQNDILQDHPTRTKVLYWIMWPAIAVIIAAGMTILVVRWRLLMEAFRALSGAGTSGDEFPLSIVLIGIVVLGGLLCYLQELYFGVPMWMTTIMVVASLPLMLVGLR